MSQRIAAIVAALSYAEHSHAPYARAVARGAAAPNLAEAFYEGYQAAIARLVSAEATTARASFCVTERGGGHPKAVQCALRIDGDSIVLDGEKSFVTGADRAALLFVVARARTRDDGRPDLRVVRVPTRADGVELESLPKTPFTPTLDHARVRLTDVRLPSSSLLEGDGYARYVKPFRTTEDVHVLGAILAYLASFVDECPESRELVERLLGAAVALEGIANRAPDSPATHLALAGVLASIRELVSVLGESIGRHPDPERAAELRRDLALLSVAETARRARREAAWAAFESGVPEK